MELSTWSDADSRKAKQIWTAYRQQHDLSHRIGQTAGIDPTTGRIWFGESIPDIVAQRDAEGLQSPLFFERVGSDTYFPQGESAVIVGTVSADGVPTLMLSIAGQQWPAIIDTGFNGDLELPEDLRAAFHARHVGRVTSALAGGQRIEEDVYIVEFPFDGHILHAEATFVADTHILLGTHLLRHYQLHIDFVAQSVRVTRKS